MDYRQKFEAELLAKLEGSVETNAHIVRRVSEEVVKSYRNGIKAGKNGAVVIRDGKSRRPFHPDGTSAQRGGKLSA
jgi:hypothetical protein